MRNSRFALLALTPILLLAGCGYNKLQGLDEEVKAAWAEVQNQYQRRADLVPALVETVKGAVKFEQDTLKLVIEARSKATGVTVDAKDLSNPEAFRRFEEAQRGHSRALSRLLVVVERYPDLKTSQQFLALQAEIAGTENRIAVARGRYAKSVAEYNTAVRSFPYNLTAKFLLGMEVRENFRADDAAAKPPQIKF